MTTCEAAWAATDALLEQVQRHRSRADAAHARRVVALDLWDAAWERGDRTTAAQADELFAQADAEYWQATDAWNAAHQRYGVALAEIAAMLRLRPGGGA